MTEQISIYAENKKGAMSTITGLLKDAEINIMSILTNDSGEFGTVRMLVSDVPLAKEVFEKAGYQVHIDHVIGIYMEDRCGGLNEILQAITDSNINIHYIYISYDRDTARPVVVMKTNESETAAFLMGKGYELVDNF